MTKKPRLDLSDAAGAAGASAPTPGGAGGGSGVNPFTGRAYSDRYQAILAKRVNLPVYVQRDDFIQMLHTHQTIVLVGETGSGKTTQVRARVLVWLFQTAALEGRLNYPTHPTVRGPRHLSVLPVSLTHVLPALCRPPGLVPPVLRSPSL
jgi:hypothetical protein